MIRCVVALSFIFFAQECIAQQLFQDASGKSNLYFGTTHTAWITYNTSDKSGTIGYTRNRTNGYDFPTLGNGYNFLYGGDIKANMKDGEGNIISGGDFKPGLTGEGILGIFTDNLWQGNYLNLFLSPTLSYTQYNYVATTATTLDKVNKWEGGILLNANFQFNLDNHGNNKKHHYYFAGIQLGYRRENNYNDLNDVQLSTLVASDSITTVYTSQTAKSGTYKGYNAMPLNIDFGSTPRIFEHNYFGFNAYLRTNIFKEKNTVNLGTGIFLADDKKPSSISGGLAWQFNDVGNVLNKPSGVFERSSLFLYVGYTLGQK